MLYQTTRWVTLVFSNFPLTRFTYSKITLLLRWPNQVPNWRRLDKIARYSGVFLNCWFCLHQVHRSFHLVRNLDKMIIFAEQTRHLIKCLWTLEFLGMVSGQPSWIGVRGTLESDAARCSCCSLCSWCLVVFGCFCCVFVFVVCFVCCCVCLFLLSCFHFMLE